MSSGDRHAKGHTVAYCAQPIRQCKLHRSQISLMTSGINPVHVILSFKQGPRADIDPLGRYSASLSICAPHKLAPLATRDAMVTVSGK